MGGSCWGAVTNLSQLIGFGRALRTCPHRRLSRPRRPRASNPRLLIGPRACPACPRASRAPSASTPTPARTAATPTAHARHARVPCARTTSRSRPAVLARRLPRTQAIARKSTGNTGSDTSAPAYTWRAHRRTPGLQTIPRLRRTNLPRANLHRAECFGSAENCVRALTDILDVGPLRECAVSPTAAPLPAQARCMGESPAVRHAAYTRRPLWLRHTRFACSSRAIHDVIQNGFSISRSFSHALSSDSSQLLAVALIDYSVNYVAFRLNSGRSSIGLFRLNGMTIQLYETGSA